jgi:hypothetical protein
VGLDRSTATGGIQARTELRGGRSETRRTGVSYTALFRVAAVTEAARRTLRAETSDDATQHRPGMLSTRAGRVVLMSALIIPDHLVSFRRRHVRWCR